MKFPNLRRLTATAAIASIFIPMTIARAQENFDQQPKARQQIFGQAEVPQEDFIAVAAPYGEGHHQLLILEQKTDERACWSEIGSEPVVVEPLLLNFDFTGICGRSTDSNGYSIRVDGQDYGLDYMLAIVEEDNELLLVGKHRVNPDAEDIVIGRTHGIGEGFLKIHLDPGWRFTQRTYNEKKLGHIYLTHEESAPAPEVDTPSASQDYNEQEFTAPILAPSPGQSF